MKSMERRPCWHTVGGKQARNQEAAGCSTTPTWCIFLPHEYVAIKGIHPWWRYTCSWIDCPSGGPFQYKTLISTRRITYSGTKCYHINENARVVNALDIIIIILVVYVVFEYVYDPHGHRMVKISTKGYFNTKIGCNKEGMELLK